MRADRLISLIMLLETKGPITAKELATELEVSQRTIYRDIDALCTSGIPIYGAPGPDGGYKLVEGYRSYLDSLNQDEVLALLSLNLPDHFTQLEFGSKLKAAILKIRSCYTHLSNQEETMMNCLYIDVINWDQSKTSWEKLGQSSTHLNILYRSINQKRKIVITYSHPVHPSYTFNKLIFPYGLVAKESRWYLVYFSQEKIRVLDLFQLIQVEEIDEYFTYPKTFRLKSFWEEWCREASKQYTSFRVKAVVPEQLVSTIAIYLKNGRVPFTPIPTSFHEQEWKEVELFFASFEEARSKLLSFGGVVKVIEPIALKYSIVDYAEQIQKLYDN